jgi:hypothetical protein
MRQWLKHRLSLSKNGFQMYSNLKYYHDHTGGGGGARTVVFLHFHKNSYVTTWGADKSLARPTSRRISFDASLVIHINSTNIPPIMIINRIYENQNLLSL